MKLIIHLVKFAGVSCIRKLNSSFCQWSCPWPQSRACLHKDLQVSHDPTIPQLWLKPHSLVYARNGIAKFHRVGELNGRYLRKSVAQRMSVFCDPLWQHGWVCFWCGWFIDKFIYRVNWWYTGPEILLGKHSQDRSMSAYIELANNALAKGELRWPSRPKFHAPSLGIPT